jgi:putative ABC transport system permease protein
MSPESLRIALRGIGANKLRSSLTVLGILIGVGAVIVLVAVGNGSSIAIQDRIQKLGTNTLTVFNRGRSGGREQRTGTQSTSIVINDADIAALNDKTQAPDIVAASPIVTVQNATATHAGATTTVGTLLGSDAAYLTTTDRPVDIGRGLTADDVTNHSRVIVLGRTTVTNLFATGTDVLGATIQVSGKSFTVIGVQAAKGTNGNQDLDDFGLIPYTATQDTLTGKSQGYQQIVIQATSGGAQNAAQAEIVTILDSRHGISSSASTPFQVLNQGSLLQTSQDTSDTFTTLLAAVAAISLLVGGIGVMNIMLVSVTERTREIGIRKAIGAPKSAILAQFITEAVILTGIGGVAGIAAGFVGSHFKIVGVKPVIAAYSIPLALGVSIAVGLFFGIYPANRAASLRPIDALRHE